MSPTDSIARASRAPPNSPGDKSQPCIPGHLQETRLSYLPLPKSDICSQGPAVTSPPPLTQPSGVLYRDAVEVDVEVTGYQASQDHQFKPNLEL